jgi:acyl carrier protein
MTDLEIGIRTVLAKVLNMDEAVVDETTSSETVPQWDSLSHINIIMHLEKSFDVTIGLDHIADMKSFNCIRDVLSTLVD